MRNLVAFGPSPLPRSLEAALRDIGSTKLQVRRSAARDLGAHIDSPARERVVRRLLDAATSDADLETRVEAVVALADGNATEAIEPLVRLVEFAVPRVEQMVLLALAELAQPGDSRVLQVALHAVESPLPALRYQGLVALRHVGGSQMVPKIASGLHDLDQEVRWVAVRLLEEITEEHGEREQSDPAQTVAPWVPEAMSSVQAVLLASSPRVVVAARLLLARWGDPNAIRSLADLLAPGGARMELQDELAAIRLVARWRVEQAKPALMKRAWPLVFETPLTFEARVALASMGDARARQAILRDLHSASAFKCARAIEPAGRLRLSEGRARLVQLLQNPGTLDADTLRAALARLDA